MDPLRLLSRSTKRTRGIQNGPVQALPSSGRGDQVRLFPEHHPRPMTSPPSRKRKRGADVPNTGYLEHPHPMPGDRETGVESEAGGSLGPWSSPNLGSKVDGTQHAGVSGHSVSLPEERKRTLKQHKLKVTWLNPPQAAKQKSKPGHRQKESRPLIYPLPLLSFDNLTTDYDVSVKLSNNIRDQGLRTPTEVQMAALPLLLDSSRQYLAEHDTESNNSRNEVDGIDLLTIAPTGSGKTLAYLIPLVHALRQRKQVSGSSDRRTSAIVLAPTRELAGQIVNEGRKLVQDLGLKVTLLRKDMHFYTSLQSQNEADDADASKRSHNNAVKADIIVATPGLLHNMLQDSDQKRALDAVCHLVLDEADVLLDPLFRNQTLNIWNSLMHPALRVSLWSATMGSNIEDLAKETIRARRTLLSGAVMSDKHEAPLIRLVVGLKDSAVPNVKHELVYAATEQGKLMGLRQLLHPTTSSLEAGPPLRPPFLVFTQTIERAVALHAELLYDIPAEAGGIDRIAVLHSDLSDIARDNVMTRFRKGEVWVLITTDLLSRGVDFLGVNGVVNYDIPTSSAAYVHRIGRTGRAGRSGGVAVTFYSQEDIPYLKHIANIVAIAHRQSGEEVPADKWLLGALPKLSKNQKQTLKKRGVEVRTSRGESKDPKAARKAKISSKSGYDRRMENRRRGAIDGSKKASQMVMEADASDETDFGGFD